MSAPARDADVATTIDRRASARARVAHADIGRGTDDPSSSSVESFESSCRAETRARRAFEAAPRGLGCVSTVHRYGCFTRLNARETSHLI